MVYVNVYCLVEVYMNKLFALLVRANQIRLDNSHIKNFDIREINDPEFVANQIVVGQSMLNLL